MRERSLTFSNNTLVQNYAIHIFEIEVQKKSDSDIIYFMTDIVYFSTCTLVTRLLKMELIHFPKILLSTLAHGLSLVSLFQEVLPSIDQFVHYLRDRFSSSIFRQVETNVYFRYNPKMATLEKGLSPYR